MSATETPFFSPTETPTRTPSPTPTPLVNVVACPRNVWVFYPYWSSTYNADKIPYDKVTHIAHAFVKPYTNGTLQVPSGYLEPLLISSAHAAGVKVIMSLGGAGDSSPSDDSYYYKGIMANAASRTALVNNIEDFLRTNQYDGVDIDWEYPSNSNDRTRLNAFVLELRAKFNTSSDPNGPHWIISGDLSADQYYGQWWDVATLKFSMNYFNLMVYDMFGTWSNMSGHESPLHQSTMTGAGGPSDSTNGEESLDYYMVTRGVPGSQIQYGMPMYGKRFDTETLYQGCPSGNCGGSVDLAYKNIEPLVGAGWTRHFDASAQSAYLTSDSAAQVITYDDPQTIRIKSDYANWTRGCAGIFSWDLTNDYMTDGSQPLVEAMWASSNLCNPTSPTVTPVGSATDQESKILGAWPLPNPNPSIFRVRLDGAVDSLQLEIYTEAMQVVVSTAAGPFSSGWQNMAVPADFLASAPNGVYFYRLISKSGGSDGSVRPKGKLLMLR
ncbi:MAG: glycosyl hydrolase family 18 protein [candidate division FCPU426 bacterium]